jgi:hypothetical protein
MMSGVTPLEMKPLDPKALAILQAMRDAVEIAQGRDVPEYHGLHGYRYHRPLEAARGAGAPAVGPVRMPAINGLCTPICTPETA